MFDPTAIVNAYVKPIIQNKKWGRRIDFIDIIRSIDAGKVEEARSTVEARGLVSGLSFGTRAQLLKLLPEDELEVEPIRVTVIDSEGNLSMVDEGDQIDVYNKEGTAIVGRYQVRLAEPNWAVTNMLVFICTGGRG
jgi:hypothetical protein